EFTHDLLVAVQGRVPATALGVQQNSSGGGHGAQLAQSAPSGTLVQSRAVQRNQSLAGRPDGCDCLQPVRMGGNGLSYGITRGAYYIIGCRGRRGQASIPFPIVAFVDGTPEGNAGQLQRSAMFADIHEKGRGWRKAPQLVRQSPLENGFRIRVRARFAQKDWRCHPSLRITG